MTQKLCDHLKKVIDKGIKKPSQPKCEDCMKNGGQWVHLRVCQSCSEVLCCDSSTSQHALNHFLAIGHSTFASAESGERWIYCYQDNLFSEYQQ